MANVMKEVAKLLGLELEEEFFLFRKNIFECLNLLSGLKSCLD